MTPLPASLATLLDVVHGAASNKLARDPVALDVRELSSFTDLIYVCHGTSTRAVDALVDAILEGLSRAGIKGFHVEGRQSQQWVLIDAGNMMIHVFLDEARRYYELERLWHDAPKIPLAA